MTDSPWRIGIWAAVSSKAQARDDKVSLEQQIAAGHDFAHAVDGSVAATFVVPGHSRDYVFWHEAEAEMPAYRQAREAIESSTVNLIHTVNADRLGRDAALISQFWSLARRHGCEIYDASMPHQLGKQSVGHRYGQAVKTVAAEEDNAARKARHEMGMKSRVRRGLMPGRPPLGYEAVSDNGRTVGYRFTDDIAAVEMVTRLFLDGYSYEAIMAKMNGSSHRPPLGADHWAHNSLRNISHNSVYAGYTRWGGIVSTEPSPHFPALWDADTHAAILREHERRNRGPYTRKGGGRFTGVARCLRCNGRMSVATGGARNQYRYYRCLNYMHRHQYGVACHINSVREDRMVAALSEWLAELRSPESLTLVMEAYGNPNEEEQARGAIEELERRNAKVRKKRLRLADALAVGKMDIDIYATTDEPLKAQVEAAESRILELTRYLESLPDIEARRVSLSDLAERFPQAVLNHKPPVVAKRLQDAGIRIYCENGKVQLIALV